MRIIDALASQFLLFGCLIRRREIGGGDFERPHHAFERSHRLRQAEILQGDAEAGMIGDRKEDDQRHLAIETARVHIRQKLERARP